MVQLQLLHFYTDDLKNVRLINYLSGTGTKCTQTNFDKICILVLQPNLDNSY